MSSNGTVGAFFNGLVIGGLAGTVTALLFAPQSGDVTRAKLRDKGIELKDKAEVTYVEAQKKVASTLTELQTAIDELSTKVDQVVLQFGESLSGEVGDLAQALTPEETPMAEESANTAS